MSILRAQEVNSNLDILPEHVRRSKFFFNYLLISRRQDFDLHVVRRKDFYVAGPLRSRIVAL
jgi:hypothetical protein